MTELNSSWSSLILAHFQEQSMIERVFSMKEWVLCKRDGHATRVIRMAWSVDIGQQYRLNHKRTFSPKLWVIVNESTSGDKILISQLKIITDERPKENLSAKKRIMSS